MNTINKVKEFHELFNHPVLDTPQIPSKERCKLRIALLRVELKELEDAIESDDVVEVADAFTDLQYVLDGAMLEFGMHHIKDALFEEVHRSNMSKACVNKKECIDTQAKYLEEGTESYSTTKDIFEDENYIHSVHLVFRKEDNKLLKSINYSHANLKAIIDSTENGTI